MSVLLSGWGCEVSQAASEGDLDAVLGKVGIPDLVVADYHLAEGTGIDLILHLRERLKAQIPALLITADRTPEVRAEAEKHGIGVQHKPVRPAALRAYVTQVFNTRQAAAE
jgi:CheY-like chemotaxis protein